MRSDGRRGARPRRRVVAHRVGARCASRSAASGHPQRSAGVRGAEGTAALGDVEADDADGPAQAPAPVAAQVPPAIPPRLAAPMAEIGVGSPSRAPAAMAAAGGAAAGAAAKTVASRKSMAIGARSTQLSEMVVTGTGPLYAGCYELNESTDVLPKRFALRDDSARAGLQEIRYVDSTGAVDGRMVDAGWTEIGGRAVIRTTRLGESLTITRTGNDVGAEAPLGPRSVRVMKCAGDSGGPN